MVASLLKPRRQFAGGLLRSLYRQRLSTLSCKSPSVFFFLLCSYEVTSVISKQMLRTTITIAEQALASYILHHPNAIIGQVIGDNNLIMGSCHIAHDCKVGCNNIFAINTLLAGHVMVEVSQDVPKYTMVAGDRAELRGLNLEGLRRSGFSVTEIRSLRAAYRKIFMPTNNTLRGIEDRLADVEFDEERLLLEKPSDPKQTTEISKLL